MPFDGVGLGLDERVGKIEQADGSTLFLDEVGDMPLAMQAALLRVLEQREVVRLGENNPRSVDFRLLAATHKNLDEEVRAGRFYPVPWLAWRAGNCNGSSVASWLMSNTPLSTFRHGSDRMRASVA